MVIVHSYFDITRGYGDAFLVVQRVEAQRDSDSHGRAISAVQLAEDFPEPLPHKLDLGPGRKREKMVDPPLMAILMGNMVFNIL